MPRVVLIFGDPRQGKSTLADRLGTEHGYHVIHLDGVYVEFVKNRVQTLYLPVLNQVIQQHYNTMLSQSPEVVQAWADHVASLVEDACRNHERVAVEGYLLPPAFKAINGKIGPEATVIRIQAVNHEYLNFTPLNIEQIATAGDDVGRRPAKKRSRRTRA